MPLSETKKILSWLYRIEPFSDLSSFDDLMQLAAAEVLKKQPIESELYLERNIARYWNALLKSQDEDRRLGRTIFLKRQDGAGRRLQWYPHELSANFKMQRRATARPAILRIIDQMSPRDYEALACVTISLAGESRFRLTPRGNEGGADFYVVTQNPGSCHIFFGSHRPLRIIGQTKKYGGPLEISEVRDFITTIEDVKKHSPSTERFVPTWFRSASGPLVGWLVSHNGAQAGALSKAQSHGILTSDSVDIAEACTFSRLLAANSPNSERAKLLFELVKRCSSDDIESIHSLI